MSLDPAQQAELERNERWLASLDAPRPSEDALARVRSAVRVAVDEQWMQATTTPAPTPETIARVKAAVRAALYTGRRDIRYRILGALSAAAALLLAVGLARFAPYGPQSLSEPRLAEDFVAAWDAIDDDAGMRSLTADLAWIEGEMDAWTDRSVRRTDELELESMQDRIDRLLTTPEYLSGTS